MAKQAGVKSITPCGSRPLSSLIIDPRVRAAFERAERDQGGALPVVAARPSPSTLPNGATLVLEAADAP